MSVSDDDVTNRMVGHFYSLLNKRALDIFGDSHTGAASSSSGALTNASADALRKELLAAIEACPLQSAAHYRIINHYCAQDDDKRIVAESSNDITDEGAKSFLSHINVLKMPPIDFLDDLLPRLQLKNTADAQPLQQSHLVDERRLQSAIASFDRQHNHAYNKLADCISYNCNAIDQIFIDFTKRLAVERAHFRRAREDQIAEAAEQRYCGESAAYRNAWRKANSGSDSRKDLFIRHTAQIHERSLAKMQALRDTYASEGGSGCDGSGCDGKGCDGKGCAPSYSLRQRANDAMTGRLETYCDSVLGSVAGTHRQLGLFDYQAAAVECTHWIAAMRTQYENWLRETLAGIEGMYCRPLEALHEQLVELRSVHSNLVLYRSSLEAAQRGVAGVRLRAGSRVRDLCAATAADPEELLQLLLQLKPLAEGGETR